MREARRSVERCGLTLAQFDVLAELARARRGGITFGELSRLLLVTSGNLTGIVDRLEKDGLVKRRHDKHDRRVVRIVLTRKGRGLVGGIMPLHAHDVQTALAFMSRKQLELLHELLAETSSRLDAARSESPAMSGTHGDGMMRRSARTAAPRTLIKDRGEQIKNRAGNEMEHEENRT
jgi:MarR family 2-MHQ and catechol resistance regulon transcriptional repressor